MVAVLMAEAVVAPFVVVDEVVLLGVEMASPLL